MNATPIPWPGLVGLLLALGCSGPDHPVEPAAPANPTPPPASATPMAESPIEPAADENPTATPATRERATFGGGCFWCTEAVLEQLDGVFDVTSGYMGGTVDDPTYQQVCSGRTGHAEVVQVTFDPQRIRYETLLDWFFRSHDPTTLNRQGADVGTQYRSVVFTHSAEQRATAKQQIERLRQSHDDPIVTELTEAQRFWPADAYHQDYFRSNPSAGYCRAVIVPKLKKLELDTDPDK
jgi:peptide-methionine (S)-S-oxide reductase